MNLVELDSAVRGVLGDNTYAITVTLWRHSRPGRPSSMEAEIGWELWDAACGRSFSARTPELLLAELAGSAMNRKLNDASAALETMP